MSIENNILPLKSNNRSIILSYDRLCFLKEELELLLSENKHMLSETFCKNAIFLQEIKANNAVEGYNDDIGFVYDTLYRNANKSISDSERVERIKNLYEGYKYIFDKKEINKNNLKELYSILSRNLLSAEDIENMGDFYRKNDVFIFYSNNIDAEPDMGISPEKIESYMNELFSYINIDNNFLSITDYFIKSQIIHFQFVNIHPYYDINGRTARTVSMWYLLNNNVYPYTIFNRAISLDRNKYYKIIKEARDFHNITFFVQYLLNCVKIELLKEHILNNISYSVGGLDVVDYQSLYYILSMKGLLTASDFMSFYNKYNNKKSSKEILETMLYPLIEKGIINVVRTTNSNINEDTKNFEFELNKKNFDTKEKIKVLKK